MAKNIFFKRIPRTAAGIRVVLIQNKYYWIVPKHMDLCFSNTDDRYIIRYKLSGRSHGKSTYSPSIEWFLENAKKMATKLHGAGKLYQVGIPESIAMNLHPRLPYHYFNTPTLVRELWDEPGMITTPFFHDQKESDLSLSELEKKRDDLLTELKDLARVTPDEALTLYTEDPTEALIAKWSNRYEH